MASAVIGALRVNLGIDSAAFSAGLTGATATLKRVGKQMRSIGATLSASVTAPIVALGFSAVSAFQESEDALAQVAAAVKSTGAAAGFTTEQLADMASALQATSTFDDEAILEGVTAQLLRFGNVTGDVFAQAQQAIIDYAARTGTDLQAATTLIGKALGDPVRAIATLRKAGVQFSVEQQAMIKSLVETGDVAAAQAIILEALTGKFGGAAAAMASTTSGSLAQAKNAWNDAMEEIGSVIAEFIPPVADALKTMAAAFRELSPQTKQWIVIIGGLVAVVGPVIGILGLLVAGILAIGAPIVAVIAAFAALVAGAVIFRNEIAATATAVAQAAAAIYTAVKTWILDKLMAVWDAVVAGVQKVGDAFRWLYNSVVGHSYIPDMVTGVDEWMSKLGDSFGSWIDQMVDGTFNLRDAIAGLLKDLSKMVLHQALNALVGGIFGGIATGPPIDIRPLGFATGGGFTVGGSGGVDSQLVAFRATPGEMVDIHKSGQDGGGRGGVTVVIQTPNPQSFRQSEGQIVSTIARAMQRAGRVT